ncbi:unnamed protein product, partial [Phaeothamnion confervicola]
MLERERTYDLALHYLQLLLAAPALAASVWRPRYWLRVIVDYSHMGRQLEALLAAEQALLALQFQVQRLAVPPLRWKRPPPPALLEGHALLMQLPLAPPRPGPDPEAAGRDGARPMSLEENVLRKMLHEAGPEWRGLHSENGPTLTLFGLLCWDVIWGLNGDSDS